MPIKIHNKDYTTVSERIDSFRKENGANFSLESEIVSNGDVVLMKAYIKDGEGKTIATGHAEEVRGSTNINRTSALENCETSAWGRALAALGYGGEQVVSANEVSDAIVNQAKQDVADWFIKMNTCIRDNMESINAIKDCIGGNALYEAGEVWFELSEEDQKTLFVAPSKGGIFTTEERDIIKNKLREAYYGGEK